MGCDGGCFTSISGVVRRYLAISSRSSASLYCVENSGFEHRSTDIVAEGSRRGIGELKEAREKYEKNLRVFLPSTPLSQQSLGGATGAARKRHCAEQRSGRAASADGWMSNGQGGGERRGWEASRASAVQLTHIRAAATRQYFDKTNRELTKSS